MGDAPKISVIVPVYNAEKYLARCMDSLCKQTFADFEVICVNDGSTDKSRDILSEYVAHDSRFVVFDKSNAGVSAARNDGIAKARGEYIHFLDADDFIDDDYYQKMYDAAAMAECDIVASGFVTNTKYARDLKYSCDFVKHTLFGKLRWTYAFTDGFVWRYLFRREFIRDNNLRFDTNMISQEDAIFVLNAIVVANAVVFVSETFYHYMFNSESALHSGDAAHHKKVKQQYKIGKKFRRDFALRQGVYLLWLLRKFLRKL
ncbi:MAG: glycosyltransferase [Alphaproteobacteria bacterium]|nr:glycosyltransferase [Alphaproteobacteria bacterium]